MWQHPGLVPRSGGVGQSHASTKVEARRGERDRAGLSHRDQRASGDRQHGERGLQPCWMWVRARSVQREGSRDDLACWLVRAYHDSSGRDL